ncbi:phenylalanine--tRNA ligase subunit beta [Candidatus Micrarchaeota archaeon]|nr:phenylalanine--tRNA ligase subunit beta [Candidatus Micrarchaeota archaeon]MBU2477207.1 phenylalanine--tRNA ligase subunit beta [Candidatus Micrarchaeota archaeon]
MPTIESSKKDLEELIGKKFSKEELEEALLGVKGELDGIEEDALKIDVKETNRPDLWSTEGIARELRAYIGKEKGIPKYKVFKGKRKAFIDKKLEGIRPKGAYAEVRNVNVTEEVLLQIIQLQEKICQSFGKKREQVAIGVFDLDKVKGNVRYFAATPSLEFVPLGFSENMSLREILIKHPKGKEYGQLIEKFEKFPLLVDENKEVLSMPPVINSEGSGKITTKTKNLFVDVTGFNQELVDVALKIMCMALADRKGKIYSVELNYGNKKIISPQFRKEKIVFPFKEVNDLLGTEFNAKEVITLMEKKRMQGSIKGKNLTAEFGDYRKDIIHPWDVIEEIAIAFDYNKLEPEALNVFTLGSVREETNKTKETRELCVGFGLQEIASNHLSSKEIQRKKMNLNEDFVEIANPVSLNWEIFRKNLLPESLDFLSKNKNTSFPQKIFEVGRTIELNERKETGVEEKWKLCICVSHSKTNFNEVKSILEAVARERKTGFKLKEERIAFFEEGKSALIQFNSGKKGFIGEVNEKVLGNFGLETKVSVIEIET